MNSHMLASKMALLAYEDDLLLNPTTYRQMLGTLQCVTMTRFDIFYVASLVSNIFNNRDIYIFKQLNGFIDI